MRRLSMKNKRTQSETSETSSDSGSEENGVARSRAADGNDEMKKDKETEETKTPRRSIAKKRQSRGRYSQKDAIDESTGDAKTEDNDIEPGETEEENGNAGKGGSSKRRKKEDHKASTSNDEVNEDEEYEVEKIIDQRTIKGRRQFLVRWKGYGADSDTWEQEKDLNCLKLIEQFLEEAEDEDGDGIEFEKSEKASKSQKTKSTKTEKKSGKTRKQTDNDKQVGSDNAKNDRENEKEFEVEKIIEVRFKKNKAREFLIRWKGFTSADDTWEPEENLNCPDLISKFMQKVEKAKTTDMRELRTNRAHTKRYTLTTHDTGRRLSRRNMDKQRATYHECDE